LWSHLVDSCLVCCCHLCAAASLAEASFQAGVDCTQYIDVEVSSMWAVVCSAMLAAQWLSPHNTNSDAATVTGQHTKPDGTPYGPAGAAATGLHGAGPRCPATHPYPSAPYGSKHTWVGERRTCRRLAHEACKCGLDLAVCCVVLCCAVLCVLLCSTYNAVARDFPLSARQVLENLKRRAQEVSRQTEIPMSLWLPYGLPSCLAEPIPVTVTVTVNPQIGRWPRGGPVLDNLSFWSVWGVCGHGEGCAEQILHDVFVPY
jgi:hypothetical protein